MVCICTQNTDKNICIYLKFSAVLIRTLVSLLFNECLTKLFVKWKQKIVILPIFGENLAMW
jgi:hypothetical protein